jgi:hypothetical protein
MLQRLHQQAFTIDAHFDLTYDIATNAPGCDEVVESIIWRDFAPAFDLIVSAYFIHNIFAKWAAQSPGSNQYLFQNMDESPGIMQICKTPADMLHAKTNGLLAFCCRLKGWTRSKTICGSYGILRAWRARYGLAWSRRKICC